MKEVGRGEWAGAVVYWVGGLRRTAGDPVRECRVALWVWPGGAARPQFWDQWAILPVPHRSLGRRQNLAAAAHAAVAATEPRPDQHVRTGYGQAEQGWPRP